MSLNMLNSRASSAVRHLRPLNSARRAFRQMPAQASVAGYELITKGGGQYSIGGGQQIDVATAGAQALLRGGSGAFVSGDLANFKNRPAKPIELYEYEACPFCRQVREACSILDLDVLFYPCPANGPTYREQAKKENGKAQFPFLKDPNTGKNMLESKDIIQYLFEQYGNGQVPVQFKLGPVTAITAGMAMLPRVGRGAQYKGVKAKQPKKPLEVWGYEASPFVKLVREVLVELEIPHLYKSVARNSPKRKQLESKWDTFQVPYMEDPNTGKASFESGAIITYLQSTYGGASA